MSHQDIVTKIPSGFKRIASTQNSKFAIISNEKRKLYGVQFHPEVTHTEHGFKLIKNFVVDICNLEKNWIIKNEKKRIIQNLKSHIKNEKNPFSDDLYNLIIRLNHTLLHTHLLIDSYLYQNN